MYGGLNLIAREGKTLDTGLNTLAAFLLCRHPLSAGRYPF